MCVCTMRALQVDSQPCQSTRTSSMGGAPLLLAMNGRGYTVLHVHNESSASGPGLQRRRDLAAAETGKQGGTMRALQVERLQRRRDLADGCKGLSSGLPLPMGFHSSSSYVLCLSPLPTWCLLFPTPSESLRHSGQLQPSEHQQVSRV